MVMLTRQEESGFLFMYLFHFFFVPYRAGQLRYFLVIFGVGSLLGKWISFDLFVDRPSPCCAAVRISGRWAARLSAGHYVKAVDYEIRILTNTGYRLRVVE